MGENVLLVVTATHSVDVEESLWAECDDIRRLSYTVYLVVTDLGPDQLYRRLAISDCLVVRLTGTDFSGRLWDKVATWVQTYLPSAKTSSPDA